PRKPDGASLPPPVPPPPLAVTIPARARVRLTARLDLSPFVPPAKELKLRWQLLFWNEPKPTGIVRVTPPRPGQPHGQEEGRRPEACFATQDRRPSPEAAGPPFRRDRRSRAARHRTRPARRLARRSGPCEAHDLSCRIPLVGRHEAHRRHRSLHAR